MQCCVVTAPPAPQTGRIEKQREIRTSDDRYHSRLLVTDARPEDSGNFTCRVKDHNGHTSSDTALVTVHSEDGVRGRPGALWAEGQGVLSERITR